MFKVLIIDDEEIIREGLRTAVDWGRLDCRLVGEAGDGDEGLALIKTVKPDIVLTDIRMPGLNGLEMISGIKQLSSECKMIILTGFRDFDYARQAVDLGAFRFLLKPTDTGELMQAVAEAVRELKKLKSEQETLSNLKKKVKEQYGLLESSPESSEADGSEGKNTKYLVNKALNHMKTNYQRNLSLKSVADELYISTWYLSKLLKKETGSNFTGLLNEIRIEEAKKLLLDPRYKIYEIANKVGYEDIPYFTKLFKRFTGLNPMDYKNRLP